MPSTNKRVNLTIPPDVYERLKQYMQETGELSDAGACLHVVVQQLNAYENNKMFTTFISKMSNDALKKISDDGIDTIKSIVENQKK